MKTYRHNNAKVAKEAEKFMRKNDHDLAARNNLMSEIDRRGIRSKQELQEFALKNGYLKTDRDVKVVKDVLIKTKLRDEDPDYLKKKREQEEVQKIMRQAVINKATPQEVAELFNEK